MIVYVERESLEIFMLQEKLQVQATRKCSISHMKESIICGIAMKQRNARN